MESALKGVMPAVANLLTVHAEMESIIQNDRGRRKGLLTAIRATVDVALRDMGSLNQCMRVSASSTIYQVLQLKQR